MTILFPSLGLILCAVGAVALAGRRMASVVVYGGALVCSIAALAEAVLFLVSGPGQAVVTWVPLGLPWLGANFRIDALSAFFLLVVNLGGAVASVYAFGYGRHEADPARVLPFYVLFLAGMNLVLLADDAFTFLFSWECMSLASWALVLAHHREPDNAESAYVYLLMAGGGTFALLLGLGLLAGAEGGYQFDTMRVEAAEPWIGGLVLVLVLIGAGSKAGLVPLHAWLPLAHPAAPSHVSALMSGVMTKVAIYGFIRIVFDLLGTPAWWWGGLVIGIGMATAALGVLYAIMQRDLKRLLAYSTVENIGIVFVGLGLALAFQFNGQWPAAALALSAALFHVLNHSLFKGLLFLGAGAVHQASGTRDLEGLGGLIHGMPQTAFCFLVGACAISALPPLNGFVSEWMLFQAVLLSPDLPQWLLRFIVPAAGAALAFAAAMAAACFVKAFGIAFLGRPRSPAAREAREVDGFMRGAMVLLALLCFAIGVLPGPVVDLLAPAVALVNGDVALPVQSTEPWLTFVPVSAERSSYNGLLLLLFIAVASTLTVLAIHKTASRRLRRGPAWDCGFPDPSPATQYTGASFAQPIQRMYGTFVFRAREDVEMPPPGDMAPARHRLSTRDLAWELCYLPVAGLVLALAARLNAFQFLTIRRYLSLVFGALVILLAGLAQWR